MNAAALTAEALAAWIEVRFDRSGGPGGQNVNKVSTRATLLFDWRGCPLLSAAQRVRIEQRLATRLAADGRLRIVAQQGRTQLANRQAAEARLVELLRAAFHTPRARRPTRPTSGSQRRRMDEKRRRSERKRERAGPVD